MSEAMGEGREISLEQLMELRGKTEAISKWLRSELEGHLETLKPLFAPKRLLGDFIRGSEKVSVPDAERNFDRLQESYRAVAGEPLNLAPRMESPLDPIPNELVLFPWEYVREPDGSGQRVIVRSPVRWILLHASPLGPTEARNMLENQRKRDEGALRKLAFHALVMKLLFDRNPGLSRLFLALRYKVEITTSVGLGTLPMVRVGSCLPAFRPSDPIVLNAARLSGASTFEELIDVEALGKIRDPILVEASRLAT